MSALRKRIAPSVPLKLEFEDDGKAVIKEFRLAWNFSTSAEVEERTGLNLLAGEAWAKLSASTLAIMFWAAVLDHHPEYGGRMPGESREEYEKEKRERQEAGLEVIRSYIDIGNADAVNDAVWDAYFKSLPKDKREKLEAARKELLEAQKARAEGRPIPLAIAPESETPANISDGQSSGPSPVTTSDSQTKSSAA